MSLSMCAPNGLNTTHIPRNAMRFAQSITPKMDGSARNGLRTSGNKRIKRNINETMSEHGRVKANFSTVDSYNNGVSCGISDVEKQYRETLSKSHNKLTKNYGRIYNKITLEKMMEQKK